MLTFPTNIPHLTSATITLLYSSISTGSEDIAKEPFWPSRKKMVTEGNCINFIVLTLPTWPLNPLINVQQNNYCDVYFLVMPAE